jgi:hypothetical protein
MTQTYEPPELSSEGKITSAQLLGEELRSVGSVERQALQRIFTHQITTTSPTVDCWPLGSFIKTSLRNSFRLC